MREIILDTETTGLSIENGHRIIEIAACEMENYVLTGKRLHFYINPERRIDKEASSVHGLTNKDLMEKPKFIDIYEELLEFIRDDQLVIHNAEFDISFLNNELKLCGVSPLKNKTLDTIKLAKTKHPGSLVNLDSLCRRFNISIENRSHHGAMIDTLLLAEVYIELIGGKQTSLNFVNDNASNDKDYNRGKVQNIRQYEEKLSQRMFEPSKNELKKHKDFVNKINNSIWNKYN